MSLSRRGGRGRRGMAVNAEINLTNLIDVAFVLLIIFIITAPMIQAGVEVTLPQAEAAPIESEEGVIVSIARDGRIFVGEVPVSSLEEFRVVYPQIVRQRGTDQAYIKADREVPYGTFAQVMGAMKRLGVAEVGLVVEPETEE